MSIRRRPAPVDQSQPCFSQAEQRERRRKWLRITYRGDFDLTAELSAIVGGLAEPISLLPRPLALRPEIDEIADAVHELLSVVVGMLAESKLLDRDAHSRTVQAVRDLAQRPQEPQITDEQIIAGQWSAALVNHVATHSGDLAAFLGRALPPNHFNLTGRSASEHLEDALRVLDLAVLDCQRRIPKVAHRQSMPTMSEINARNRARWEQERADRAVSKMKRAAR